MKEKQWVKVGVVAGLLCSSQLGLVAIAGQLDQPLTVTAHAATTEAQAGTDYNWQAATGELSINTQAGMNWWVANRGAGDGSLTKQVKAVTFGDGVTEIPAYAFSTLDGDLTKVATNLQQVRLSETLKKIGNGAFSQCSALSGTLVIPASVESLGDANSGGLPGQAFALTGVETVIFETGSQVKGLANAFLQCPNLKKVVLPENLTNLYYREFMDDKQLNELVFTGKTAPQSSGDAFDGMGNAAVKTGQIVHPAATDYQSILKELSTAKDGSLTQWTDKTYAPIAKFDVPQTLALTVGKTQNIHATVQPADYKLSYEVVTGTSNFKVDAQGNVTADQAGTGKVKVTAQNTYGVTSSKEVTVSATNPPAVTFTPVKGITGLPTEMQVGVPLDLKGTVTPANATNQDVTFELVEPQDGVTLTDQKLSADRATTVKLRAIVKNGLQAGQDFTQNFSVVARPKANTYAVNFTAGEHGKLIGGLQTTVVAGAKIPGDKIPTPQADPGYLFSHWEDAAGKVVDNWNDITVNATTTYTAVFTKINDENGSGDDQNVTTLPLQRLYNPNSGEHFYTTNGGEKDNLVRHGWNYEGITGNVAEKGGDAVYRLYNKNAGDHHYTKSASERDWLVSLGWKYELVAFQSAGPVDVYRLYNPNAISGAHHYTQFAAERDHLAKLGWSEEGIGWNAY
ncbi:leucine-rich repeat protein [Enterococcus sp. CSURQ0835]|uniref:leucine-rich repeat protein n=1 Tax=Enterococcus sp. CSURQ0835 TaxID=2681394 RepID=UPI001356BE81|nr:leucine-rich repeat protein [Enterococcus sp. CSURQ0835]